ncbi:MAG: SusC/RagA family TonB-linked outer membrane protein [Bacteroidia bacterium]
MIQHSMIKGILLLTAMLWSLTLLGQQQVKGVITGEDDQALVGASVNEVGTANGVFTDEQGAYQITVAENAQLIFSYVGYDPQTVAVDGRSSIDMNLTTNFSLGEVVVVGYGSQKKVNLTGAVQTLDLGDLVNAPVTNSAQLMYGRFAGVTLTQGGGLPGSDGSSINIRGLGTFNNSSPLIVIDGMIVEQAEFNNLAPSDVASISVLKDASAGAIYGARAANGVILITTKSGEAGKTRVEYGGYYGWQQATVTPDFADAQLYATLLNEKFRNENPDNFDPRFTDEQLALISSGADPDLFANTNWVDQVLETAPITNHYLSFSGGNTATTYKLSLGYLNQDAISVGNFRNSRYNFRLNLKSKLNQRLTLTNNLSGWVRDFQGPSGGPGSVAEIIYQFARTSPTMPVRYSNGEFAHVDGAFNNSNASFISSNPVRELSLGNYESQNFGLNERISLKLEIAKGLSFETANTLNLNISNISNFQPRFVRNQADGTLVTENVSNSLSNSVNFNYSLLTENLLRYSRKIGSLHDVQVLVGHSAQRIRTDGFAGSLSGFPTDNLEEFNAGGIIDPVVTGGAAEVTRQSFFGRLNYVLADKYLFEANIRRDGSSRFGPGNRYGNFPSFSAGWRISEESFMKSVKAISNLKLRASWGRNGNDRINNFIFQQTFALGQDYVLGEDQAVSAAAITTLANPDIRWETTEQFDIGLDASFFKSQLQFTADYFVKNSFDVLYNNFPIPSTLGVGNLEARNAADVMNKGIELGLNYRKLEGEFTYGLGANLTYLTNEVTGLGDGQETISGNTILRVGEPIRAYYGYQVLGIFQNQEEIDAAPIHFNGTGPGDFQYVDFSGPEGEPDGVIDAEDRVIIGNPYPTWTYNMNGFANYRGFDFSFVFQGVQGIDRLMFGNGQTPMTDDRRNVLSYWENRWTAESPSTELPRLGNLGRNDLPSTFYIQDASYLRLKNIELGYTLPENLTQAIGLTQLRVYASGQNILTFSQLENFDPERASGNFNARNFPIYKVFTLGLNVSL